MLAEWRADGTAAQVAVGTNSMEYWRAGGAASNESAAEGEANWGVGGRSMNGGVGRGGRTLR